MKQLKNSLLTHLVTPLSSTRGFQGRQGIGQGGSHMEIFMDQTYESARNSSNHSLLSEVGHTFVRKAGKNNISVIRKEEETGMVNS